MDPPSESTYNRHTHVIKQMAILLLLNPLGVHPVTLRIYVEIESMVSCRGGVRRNDDIFSPRYLVSDGLVQKYHPREYNHTTEPYNSTSRHPLCVYQRSCRSQSPESHDPLG
jgi:hypothetical protein